MDLDEFAAKYQFDPTFPRGKHIRAHLPCFIERRFVPDCLDTLQKIRTYIELCQKADKGEMSVHCFSVTEQDAHHARWRKVAKEYNAQVVEGHSIHGDYRCWAIFIQNSKFEGMDYYY